MLFTKAVAVIKKRAEMVKPGKTCPVLFSHQRPLCAKLSPTTASLCAFACVLACKGTLLLGLFKLNQKTFLAGQAGQHAVISGYSRSI